MNDPDSDPILPAVALVRANNRRGAVAEALALLEEDLIRLVGGTDPSILLIPTLGPSARRSTPAAVLSAVVDAVLAVGGRPAVTHPESPGDPWGFRAECWGRPVDFLDSKSRHIQSRILLATIADFRIVDSCAAGLVIVEGPLDWRGRRVVAVAGADPIAVSAVSAHECGIALGGRPLDISTLPLLGDPPRGPRSARYAGRRDAGHRPTTLAAIAPRAAAPSPD